jgi:hypothetical protein
MVRRLLVFAPVLAFVLAVSAAAPRAQNSVTGDWTLTINGPQGTLDTDASFTQDGEKVTGTMSSPMGETNFAGTMSGSTLSLAFNVVTPNGPIDVRMTAEVAGAEMKGTLDFGMGTADFTGKKK